MFDSLNCAWARYLFLQGRDHDEEPTIIRCDSVSCKLLSHPSCLGNSAPLWFCPPCQDSVIIEPAVNQLLDTSTLSADQVCSICQRHVEDSDSGLQCDICDTWKNSNCLGISDDKYGSLINSAENFFCSCLVGGSCGLCRMMMDKNLGSTQIISCRSSCDRKCHTSCIDSLGPHGWKARNDGDISYWECPYCYIQPNLPSFVGKNDDKDRVKEVAFMNYSILLLNCPDRFDSISISFSILIN